MIIIHRRRALQHDRIRESVDEPLGSLAYSSSKARRSGFYILLIASAGVRVNVAGFEQSAKGTRRLSLDYEVLGLDPDPKLTDVFL